MKNSGKTKKILTIMLIFAFCFVLIGIFAGCKDNEETDDGKVYMEKDTLYLIEEINLFGKSFAGFAEDEKSYIKLTKQGEMEVRLTPTAVAISTVNIALAGMNSEIDVSGFEIYLKGLFPTESFEDMKKTVERLEKDMGIYVEGLDYESTMVKNLFQSLKESGKIPKGTILPEKIAFSVKGKYELKTIQSKTQEEPLRAVYFGDYNELGDPYIILTQYTDEEGNELIKIRNEILNLTITAREKQQENTTEQNK